MSSLRHIRSLKFVKRSNTLKEIKRINLVIRQLKLRRRLDATHKPMTKKFLLRLRLNYKLSIR